MRILFIDDEQAILNAYVRVLRPCRDVYEVVCESDPDKAMHMLRNQSFDVVVTDICMKKFDGFEILKYVTMNMPETKIMVATGFASVDTVVQSMRMGAWDYLKKPIIEVELIKKLENIEELNNSRKDIDEYQYVGTLIQEETERAKTALVQKKMKIDSLLEAIRGILKSNEDVSVRADKIRSLVRTA